MIVEQRSVSRPLSEISENEDLRRMSARVSSYSSTVSLKAAASGDRVSRPSSEVRDDPKRVSVPVHTITLNLSTYTGSPAPSPAPPKISTAVASAAPSSASPVTLSSALSNIPPPPPASPSKRKSLPPAKPEKPATLSARPSLANIAKEADKPAEEAKSQVSEPVHETGTPPVEEVIVDLSETHEEQEDGVSPLFMATRAALRPTQVGGVNEAGAAAAAAAVTPLTPTVSITDSSRTSVDSVKPPVPRAKPGWLRRASMTQSLGRSKSRSPANITVDLPAEKSSPQYSSSTLPALPPRKFPAGPMDMPVAGPSRAPPPPQHPARESVSHHSQSLSGMGRRWTRTSGNNSNVTRSSSNTSIASSASHQYLASSAQRVLGHAGNAVSKTWMRARGVGSSMSISGMAQMRPNTEFESGSPGLTRKLSRDTDFMPSSLPTDTSMFGNGVVKRRACEGKQGMCFGRDLGLAGRTCGVYDAADERIGESDYQRRRRQCLPAVAIRCVEYLELWGPQEEGIFRISGRNSHIVRLRREFDAGADLDLTMCDPSDLDPHAISGTYKSFLRDLPESMLLPHIEQRVDEYLLKHSDDVQELADLLAELPSANWFLLADVIMLIDLIPRHADVNRMSYKALMISLGPTLRISGDHVELFVRHREQLFAHPPSVSPRDMVDFGDDEIPPLSPMYEETTPTASTFKRPAPRVSKKPSFGNLLGTTRSAMRKSQSEQALSASPVPPPRLDLPPVEQVELPSFSPEAMHMDPDETEELNSLKEASSAGTSPSKNSDFDDATYTAAGNAHHARVYSTPIADRFRSSSSIDRVKGHTSGAWSVSSMSSFTSSVTGPELAPPPNPMIAIRRSPPVFFQSTNSGTSSSGSSRTGVKRKDDAGAERTREGDSERDSAKRLSFGPTLDDEEAMVTGA